MWVTMRHVTVHERHAQDANSWWQKHATLCYLLCINAVNTVSKPKLLEHEITARLQQLSYDAVWLLQIPLNQ